MSFEADARAERELIISFIDLSTFTRDASHREEAVIAETMDAYYERVAHHAATAAGIAVKFIGDGALLVFPTERADDAVRALLALRDDVDAWMARECWVSRLMVKAHTGKVVAGGFGPRGAKRFDVIGNVVNTTARLPRPFHVTPQLFRLLSPDARRRFKKHTPPVTYIPTEDGHG